MTTQTLRMHDGLPALLVDPDAAAEPPRDRAMTAVLSGRADLVGAPV